ncbi:MAG: FadR family transcriptional regulator [Spirochaetales bacterium]|nr:FadR family transcriptional regulator [Spirochaetales bacterium]
MKQEDIIRQRTVVTQVMEEMRNRISSGEYKPGEKIPTEAELSQMFGIGRSSIREAIKIFNYLGVLKSETGMGTRVCESANITTKALSWALIAGARTPEDLLELRDVIERQSLLLLTRTFKENPSGEEIIILELQNIIQDFRKALEADSKKDIIETDYRFHYAIIRGSGNEVFIRIWEALRFFLLDEIEKVETLFPSEDIISEHQQILDAVMSGDEQAVIDVHSGHINDIMKKLLSIQS